jgi:RNA polymerase sigma-70 factor (ECF subfamily)
MRVTIERDNEYFLPEQRLIVQQDAMNMTALIIRCQAGEADAIQDLVREHQASVFRLALSILDDSTEAEEATQDSFLVALRTLQSYRADSSFSTWLYRITVNQCLSRLRKRRARQQLTHALQSIFRLTDAGTTHPEDFAIQRELDVAIWKAVSSLGEKHRLPVILYYYQNLSVLEIASVLNLHQGTVLSRLYTARERLRAFLE